MSVELVKELYSVVEQFPAGTLHATQLAILRVIADGAHHETDEAHKGGKPRHVGKEMLRPREMFIPRETMAQHVGTGAANVRRQLREMESLGLKLRVRDGRPGMSTVYRFPTVEQLYNAYSVAEFRKHHEKTDGATVVTPIRNCG